MNRLKKMKAFIFSVLILFWTAQVVAISYNIQWLQAVSVMVFAVIILWMISGPDNKDITGL